MNDIIRYVLPNYLDYLDLLNFSLTCKENHRLLKNILFEKKLKKQEQIEKFFNFYILDIISKEKLLNARYIPWKEEYNFLKDFNEFHGSMAYTKDYLDRSFIFVKIKVEDPLEYHLPKTNYTIMAIFQKYSKIEVYFLSDPKNFSITTMLGGVVLEKEYYLHLKNFFLDGSFSYSDFPYVFPFRPLYEKMYIFKEEDFQS